MINWSIGTSDDGQVIDDDDHDHDNSYDGGDEDVLSPQRSGLRSKMPPWLPPPISLLPPPIYQHQDRCDDHHCDDNHCDADH